MLRFHSFLIFLSPIVIIGVLFLFLSKSDVNPKVYVKSYNGSSSAAPVTYTPHLDANALGRKLKDDLNRVLSYSISNPKKHIEMTMDYIHPSFRVDVREYLLKTISSLKTSNVRVVDFVITSPPVFVGSEVGLDSNWVFYLEGYFSYQGIFSKSTGLSESVSIFVKLQRTQASSANPLGVGVYDIIGLPNF